MITTKSKAADFLTEFTDGTRTGLCDAPVAHGGAGGGFMPSTLLETALAACLNITLRVYAKHHDITLDGVETTVNLVPGPDGSVFEYSVKIEPEGMDPKVRERLLASLKGCPIHNILTRPISVRRKED